MFVHLSIFLFTGEGVSVRETRPPDPDPLDRDLLYKDTPGQRPPVRDPPYKDTPGQRPSDRDPPVQRHPWTETVRQRLTQTQTSRHRPTLDRGPPGQKPPLDRDRPLDRDPLTPRRTLTSGHYAAFFLLAR